MTLHDKLKEILPDVPDSTIAAIIQEVIDRLPDEMDQNIPNDLEKLRKGWNAYRLVLLNRISPFQIDTGNGFKRLHITEGSFDDPDSST